MAYSDNEKHNALILLDKTENNYEYVGNVIGCSKRTLTRWRREYTPLLIKKRLAKDWNLPAKSKWGYRYVYAVRESFRGLIKIGIASDLNARLWSMQTGCPQELEVIGYALVKKANYYERLIHSKLCNKQYRGEWFELENEDVQWLLGKLEEWHTKAITMLSEQKPLFA